MVMYVHDTTSTTSKTARLYQNSQPIRKRHARAPITVAFLQPIVQRLARHELHDDKARSYFLHAIAVRPTVTSRADSCAINQAVMP
jgi:hypothetical protein